MLAKSFQFYFYYRSCTPSLYFIKLRDHSSDVESTSYFLGCYDVEKGTDISLKFLSWQVVLSSNVPKKKQLSFGFDQVLMPQNISYITSKQLWCNADIQIVSEFSSVIHLYWKKCCFSLHAFVLCWHKVLSFIAII